MRRIYPKSRLYESTSVKKSCWWTGHRSHSKKTESYITVVLGFHSGNVRRSEILKAFLEMLPFSLGFICLLGGHLPHIACKPCLFVLDLQWLPISHRVKTQDLSMAHRAPQLPIMPLAASPTTPLPLLALFQSHCPPHSSLSP